MKARGPVGDYFELTKPRITGMVVVSAAIGYFLGAAEGAFSWPLLALALLGTGLLSAGGSALNHLLERDTDALMERTADRPLPSGRLAPVHALVFGLLLSGSGVAVLVLGVNVLTAILGAGALAGYVGIYTPLKRLTSLSTLVGAVPGALPPVMGWTAAQNQLGAGAWILFGILFLWQLPHFLAIAWLCRDDYRAAGFPMLPVLDPGGRRTARQAILYAAALLPVSLLPTVFGISGMPYAVGALLLGLVFLGFCVAFSRSFSNGAARRLLLVSVLYLPAVLTVMLVDRAL